MIATKKALELSEIEERTLGKAQIAKFQAQEMSWKKEWIHRIAEEHPAFQGLPQRIKDALKEDPSESLIPLANRRKRKFWRSNGVVIHAFAGEKDGYTLSRALKEVGGDCRGLYETDLEHGGAHHDLGPKGDAWTSVELSLLRTGEGRPGRAAMQNQVETSPHRGRRHAGYAPTREEVEWRGVWHSGH